MVSSITTTGRLPGRARAAFTLVELVVVVAIIALLGTMVSQSIDSFLPRERLNTSVRVLTENLRATRSEAISRSLTYYVQYDLDNNRYRRLSPFDLEGNLFQEGEDDDEDRAMYSWEILPPDVEIAAVTVAGITYTEGTEIYARFDGRGTASDHQVILTQPRFESFYTVEVLALTGLFKFHRGQFTRRAPDDGDFQ